MNSSRAFRFGLAGSRWGLNFLRTAAQHSEWEIPLVARRGIEPLATPFQNVRVTNNWRELADTKHQIDAVIIATPPSTHVDIALFFIEQGIPCIIEKPLCLCPRDAQSIIEAATVKRAIVWVDHTHLYHPAFRRMKAELAGGTLLSIRGLAGNDGPFRPDTPVLWDWLPHDLAMLLELAGHVPESVSVRTLDRVNAGEGTGETIELAAEFTNGLRAHFHVSNMMKQKTRLFAAKTSRAAYRYDGIGKPALVKLPADTPDSELLEAAGEELAVEPRLPLEILLSDFVKAVQTADTRNSSLALGGQIVELLARAGAT